MFHKNCSPFAVAWMFILGVMLASCATVQAPIEGQTPSTTSSNITPQTQSKPETLPTADPFIQKRQKMVEATIQDRGVSDPQVLRAMLTVPRHEFVTLDQIEQAYDDHPLPIGYGQTISQPYIVAWMTELLDLKPGEKVLEIGTGSGYQAAVLAELGGLEVYSIEIVPELAAIASARLQALGYDRVKVKQADGYYGWSEYAPFDAIIITAAPDHLPAPLAAQLKDDGRLVVPIGPPGGYQVLWKFVKESGELRAYDLGMVSFVPFTGEGVSGGGTPVP